jgi:hypothetical protein
VVLLYFNKLPLVISPDEVFTTLVYQALGE